MIYWFYFAPIIEIKIFDVLPWKKIKNLENCRMAN